MSGIISTGRRGSVLVPNWRWEDQDLDPYALRVAGWIASHADTYLRDYVTRNEIARRTGISAGKVTGSLNVLSELGIVDVIDVPIEQSAGGHRLQIRFNFDVWEDVQPRSPHDRAPVTTRPDPGHHMTSTKGAQEEEQRDTSSTDVDGEFAAFWELYPNKVSKPHALKAWRKARRSADAPAVIAGLAPWLARWKAEQTEKKFIPHASTWLNGERWTDAPAEPAAPKPATVDPGVVMAITAFAQDLYGDCSRDEARNLVEVATTLSRWGFGDGEIAVRMAAMMKRCALYLMTPPAVANMPYFDRFRGDPRPAITGDEPDLMDAMKRAYANQRWSQ